MSPNSGKPPDPVKWRVHLAANDPGRTAVIVAVAAAVAAVGHFLLGVFGVVIGVGLVVGSTSEFLFPIHYMVSEKGARARWAVSVAEIEWDRVKQVRTDEAGMKLSPLAGKSRFEAFRGVYLRFAGNRQEIEEAVRYWYHSDEVMG